MGRAKPPGEPPLRFLQTSPAPAATGIGSKPPLSSRESPTRHPSATRQLGGSLRPTCFQTSFPIRSFASFVDEPLPAP